MRGAQADKVASGGYATESEVIRDGLRTLHPRDAALEAWLQGEVAKSCDELVTLETTPSKSTRSIGQMPRAAS